MFSGLVRYLRLTAQARTGVSPAVVICAAIALISAVTTFLLLVFSAFIWLTHHYTPLTAALILTGFFLLITILAGIGVVIAQRRTAQRAAVALAARGAKPWLDPSVLSLALQLGRNIGLRRILPLVAAGVLAAGFAKEWLRDRPTEDPSEEV
jgi:ABC-type Na+ efflux pump permease subunit